MVFQSRFSFHKSIITHASFSLINRTFLSLILVVFGHAASANSNEMSRLEKAEQLIAFCQSTMEMNEMYLDAIVVHEDLLNESFHHVKENNKGTVFQIDKAEFVNHYGDSKSDMLRLERMYLTFGRGIEIQEEFVAEIKKIQRRIKKIEVFTKAYADYVNTSRYLNDGGKSEGTLIIGKIKDGLNELKKEIVALQNELSDQKYKSEGITIAKHERKSLLIPMNKDIIDLEFLLRRSEVSTDAKSIVTDIKAKRNELALGSVKRNKEAKYVLKEIKKRQQFEEFYFRYQSLLTKMQNVLKNGGLEQNELNREWLLIRGSIDKLQKAYGALKG